MLIVGGIYVYSEVPGAEHGTQALDTTVLSGDYTETAVTITGGTLVSSRPAGMEGELTTLIEYEMAGETNAWRGPWLVARVAHDSGAIMVCRMGKSYLLDTAPSTYRLRCDRTVDVDKLSEWTVAEVTPMRYAPINYG